MAKQLKLVEGSYGDLEVKVAAQIATSPTRKEALEALAKLNPATDRVQVARDLFLKVMGEEGLSERQRSRLLLRARGQLRDASVLLERA